jgi:hypothetical protein
MTKHAKYGYEMHNNFPVGRKITDFTKGSWQESEYTRGARTFYEPLEAAPRTPDASAAPAVTELSSIALQHAVELPQPQEV